MNYRIVYLLLTLLCGPILFGDAWAEGLAYRWKVGDQFAYQVKIEVDKPDEVETYEGVLRYEVNQSDDRWSQLTFRGGMPKQSKRKAQYQTRDPREMIIRMPSFPDPFARNRFAGTSSTTNKLTISSTGETVAMEGDSQLPYLIGNISQLPFEHLQGSGGNGNADAWQIVGDITVEQSDGQSRSMFPSAFGQQAPRKVRTASEQTSFQLQGIEGSLKTFKKTYLLKAPPIGDKAAYSIQGQGTWVFDAVKQRPHSLRFEQSLMTEDSNVSVRVPIKITYDLLSEEQLAEMDRESTERREKMARDAEERKRQQETPLTIGEQRLALKSLASGNDAQLVQTLNELAQKNLQNPDPKIVAAIEKRLNDPNRAVASSADRAMKAWSPVYEETVKLNQAYHDRSSPVDSTGLRVQSTRQLFGGQIIQAQNHGSFWYPAEVMELLPRNRVLAKMRGGSREEIVLDLTKIQLAPDLVDQPARPSRSSRSPSSRSTPSPFEPETDTESEDHPWTDVTGKHKIEAEFIEISGDSVKLKRVDGKEIIVPLEKLSQSDQQRAKALQDAIEADDNPFD
ncbi:SHD1 domain-containing protein [Rubripirellula reticaptiva]|uniref:SHD1 domain-containing protein n=1 Tax=Rubripirellula reticaptiva TaxID=2528013 RepID=UPI001644A8AA|nr:SHD1 domain-containing protein [Rubripirellula reticaptiva]